MKRIELLDSFRCLAILMVILDHYTSTFTKANTLAMYPHIALSLYPYGDKYHVYFENGYLGVELFFIISGFVIYLTLEKTASFKNFIVKRFFRLFPLLLICSIITYLVPFFLDPDAKYLLFHRPAINFFPSLSFTDLWMWNKIFHIQDKLHNVEYIDNAYWTLGIEMKFYVYISIVYFTSNKNFFKHWLYYTLGLICIYSFVLTFKNVHFLFYFKNLLETTFFAKYIIYFSLGALFYRLYKKIPITVTEYSIIFFSILLCAIFFMPVVELVALFIFSSLFLVFICKPDYLSILSSKPILFIGLISYPLYLIHQNIGVLLLNVLSDTFKVKYSEILIFPVTLLILFLAYLLHKYIERPLGNISKRIFQKREV